VVKHILNSNVFYVISGLSGSGKSYFIKKMIADNDLPPDILVSYDDIRKQVLGVSFGLDEFGVYEKINGWDVEHHALNELLEKTLSMRFRQKLPVVFDATNLNDEVRSTYINLAAKHGYKSKVLIFDIDVGLVNERLSKRKERFDSSVRDKQLLRFSLTSKFDYATIKDGDSAIMIPNLLQTSKIDVVGDVHGLYDETVALLKKSGWNLINDRFVHSDKERKVLFLGDVIDRGPKSIELLELIKNTVKAGDGLFIMGNHEEKLLQTVVKYYMENKLIRKSISSSQTVMKFLRMDHNKQTDLIDFLNDAPVYCAIWIDKNTGNVTTDPSVDSKKIAFGHADLDYFDPFKTPKSFILFGKKRMKRNGVNEDTDLEYETLYQKKINKYIYFRGHFENQSAQNNVFSLEDGQAFAGNLISLSLDKYIDSLKNNNWNSTNEIFKKNIVLEKSHYNFNDENRALLKTVKELTKLTEEKLINENKFEHPDGFKIYKYNPKVHFKNLWSKSSLLFKMRGIAFDIAGNIIVHPFDKIFNYGENNTGHLLSPEKEVYVVEKLNGFMGSISPHPFKNELLLSTTGSFNSDFIKYINDFITVELRNNMLDYFKTNKQTLLFEVLHPEDKHIIEYKEEDLGLWLIGARNLDYDAKLETEEKLDEIAKKIGLRRPSWEKTRFEEVIPNLENKKIEGYMIRDAETHETIMKIKSNYYLITKFIGRMRLKMVDMMYNNTEKFKELHMDEECYPIVDAIVSKIPKVQFEEMEQKERVDFVRDIVNSQRVLPSNKNKIK
jgi:predicted kinase/adenylate kinase family enzyme